MNNVALETTVVELVIVILKNKLSVGTLLISLISLYCSQNLC